MCQAVQLRMTKRALLRHCPGSDIQRLALPPLETIRPGSPMLVLLGAAKGSSARLVRWGLVGHFLAAEPAHPPLTLCGEGLVTKPFYSKILQRNRCLIPATAFFAMQALAGGKRQVRVSQGGGRPMMFAGVFDQHPLVGASCAIITRPADASLGLLPDRVPVLLDAAECAFWLADYSEFPDDEFAAFLHGGPMPALNAEPVPVPEISPQLSFAFA